MAENNKKPQKGKKTTKKDLEIDEKVRKKVLADAKDQLKKEAEKLALQLATKAELDTQVELTPNQLEAALLIGSGYSFREAADRLEVSIADIEAWMKMPTFARKMNEYSIKGGASDKNDRVRKTKRIVEELHQALLAKIANNDLSGMTVFQVNEMLLKQAARLDKLVDEDNKDVVNKDLTILILNHAKDASGKEYKSLKDMFDDDEYKFPTIDVSAENA